MADEASARLAVLARPRWGLRIAIGLLVSLILVVTLLAITRMRTPATLHDLGAFVQVLESAINDVVFVAIALAFLVTIETRLKRQITLRAIHELRSLAHIVDMHQLTKDPDLALGERGTTAARNGADPHSVATEPISGLLLGAALGNQQGRRALRRTDERPGGPGGGE